MVVHYLYVMILISGLFQSIDFIDGLRCYQCDHPGTVTTTASCESSPCSTDKMHKNLSERFYHAKTNIKNETVNKDHLELLELCYLQIRRPIPFNGHTRGCYASIKFKNQSMELDFLDAPSYEDWYVCYTDDCNDWDITSKYTKLKKVYDSDPSRASTSLPNSSHLIRVVTTLVIINYLGFKHWFNAFFLD